MLKHELIVKVISFQFSVKEELCNNSLLAEVYKLGQIVTKHLLTDNRQPITDNYSCCACGICRSAI